jgi:hypothetical protein
MVWPVFSVTFLATMRWIVSALAPGVNGITMVIGRDDSSSAAASLPAIPFTAKAAARITATLGIELSQHEGAGNDAD